MAACLLLLGCEADDASNGQPEEAETDTAEADTEERRADDSESGGEPDDDEPRTEPSHPDRADGEKVFHGTAVEHAEAKAECYERLGATVTPDPDDPTILSVDIGGVDDELMDELSEQCREEIGRYTPESYPDGYLKRIYEHRLWQRECLIDRGHDLPTPPSFEEFLDTLQTPDSFTPLGDTGLRGPDFLAAEEECPGLHQWEQQQGLLD